MSSCFAVEADDSPAKRVSARQDGGPYGSRTRLARLKILSCMSEIKPLRCLTGVLPFVEFHRLTRASV